MTAFLNDELIDELEDEVIDEFIEDDNLDEEIVFEGDEHLPLQVNKDGKILHDFDNVIRSNEKIYDILKYVFKGHSVKKGKDFIDDCPNIEYIIDDKTAILVKNCTWLNYDKGRDDYRVSKRRIQLSDYFPAATKEAIDKGLDVYYVGLYSYGGIDDYLYVVFETDEYIKRETNNSAAHVSIFDLAEARNEGSYFKIDDRNNKIHVFDKDNFVQFITNYEDSSIAKDVLYQEQLIDYFTKFWKSLPKYWNGIKSYETMCRIDYKNQFQTRWEGFIYEYAFEKYLNENPTSLIEVYGDKTDDGIDLDLVFPKEDNFYGDLKNDNTDSDIMGNDKSTIDFVIKNNGHIWYVCSRFKKVILDKDKGYVVKKRYIELKEAYNKSHKPKKPIKYDKYNDLKYSYEVDRYFIIDIKPSNYEYLGILAQGRNSDGKPREPKYKVLRNKFIDFIKYELVI